MTMMINNNHRMEIRSRIKLRLVRKEIKMNELIKLYKDYIAKKLF
jgi:hypothetical protein